MDFTFQMIIDIAGVGSAIFRCGMRGFTSHNNYLQKKLINKYTKKLEFSNGIGNFRMAHW